MCTGLEIAAGVALIGGIAGTAYSVTEQQKQASKLKSAQEDARKMDIALQNEQAARDRRAQIREARIQRAMVDNTAAASGMGGGSAAIVGGQNATQQAGVNIGNINTAQSASKLQGIASQNIANAQNQGPSMLGSLAGSVGSQLMNMGIEQGTKSIFKDKETVK